MKKKFVYQFEAMSTLCELSIFAESKLVADKSAKAILEDTKRLEFKYSYYDENSLLYQINTRSISLLDRETKSLLQRAIHYFKETHGVFDITVATIKNLYVEVDTIEELSIKKEFLKSYIGSNHISIKKNKIIFDNEYTKIDFGGIVKEYAVDRASEILKKNKIFSGLINYGGDIYAHGKKPDGTQFKVGIKDPKNPSKYVEEVYLEDEALTTSASYERYYEIGTKRYSHILTKEKNLSVPLSASVISRNCVESGVYSTALMIDKSILIKNKSLRTIVI